MIKTYRSLTDTTVNNEYIELLGLLCLNKVNGLEVLVSM